MVSWQDGRHCSLKCEFTLHFFACIWKQEGHSERAAQSHLIPLCMKKWREKQENMPFSPPPPLAWIAQLLRKISSSYYFLNLTIIIFAMITLKRYVLHAGTPTNVPVTALSRQILSGCTADRVGSCTALSFCAPQVLPCLSSPSLNHLSNTASYPLLTSIHTFSIGNGVGIFTLWSFIWVAGFSLGSSLLISPASFQLYWQ